MNSRKTDDYVDQLFTEAFQPYALATPPRDAAKQLRRRIQAFSRLAHRFVTLLNSFGALNFSLSHQPYSVKPYGQFRPSPYLGVTVSRLSVLRIAS